MKYAKRAGKRLGYTRNCFWGLATAISGNAWVKQGSPTVNRCCMAHSARAPPESVRKARKSPTVILTWLGWERSPCTSWPPSALIANPEHLLSVCKCLSALLCTHLMLSILVFVIFNFMSSQWWWLGLAWEKFRLILSFRLLMYLLNKGY